MPVKTDRNDARGIAQLMRLGWFRPVHCKSMGAQEMRALLTARKLVQSKLYDIEISLRGILRGFGLKVGQDDGAEALRRGSRNWSAGQPSLEVVAEALLAVHAVRCASSTAFEKQRAPDGAIRRAGAAADVDAGGRPDRGADLCSAIDDPARFTSSKPAGAHFGLTPKKYQSGETDYTGRISKIGDGSVRTALYEAAHVMLTRPIKGGRNSRAGRCGSPGAPA